MATSNNTEQMLSSKEIMAKAIAQYNPYAIVSMVSGGDDSLTAIHVARQLNIPITHILHGVTGTGIQEVTEFVRSSFDKSGLHDPLYIEANAGDAYVNYVMRKGFFGTGMQAHNYSYHILKWNNFRRTVSTQIRHKKRNRNILFVNGARRMESENRMKTMINPIKAMGSNIWVNIINEWTKDDCKEYLYGNSIQRSPVAIQLCRSGECMCGTMQSKADRIEASAIYPKWGQWLDNLEKRVRERFNWGWGENMPKPPKPTSQMQMDFQPMCVGCTIKQ